MLNLKTTIFSPSFPLKKKFLFLCVSTDLKLFILSFFAPEITPCYMKWNQPAYLHLSTIIGFFLFMYTTVEKITNKNVNLYFCCQILYIYIVWVLEWFLLLPANVYFLLLIWWHFEAPVILLLLLLTFGGTHPLRQQFYHTRSF